MIYIDNKNRKVGEIMIKKTLRIILSLVGITLGAAFYVYLERIIPQRVPELLVWRIAAAAIISLLFGLIFYMISPFIMKIGQKVAARIEREVSSIPPMEILTASFGLIIGLIIAYFISGLVINIPLVGTAISTLIYIFFGYIGINIATKRKDDFANLINVVKPSTPKEKLNAEGKGEFSIPPKILDTSVIIDGRIADITQSGFLEGELIVPTFVLEELRHIADSSDDLKRVRGRRGLDILNMMQKELKLNVHISEQDFDDISEVDMKLLKLAQTMNGHVITNDYNLNKVAQFQGVKVLNINELANAIKPIVIPGEEMNVTIVKEGKEHNQGIAYLDDGTMIVVEGARKLIGQNFNVLVTSVLQTAAGRMIFAKLKN